MCQLTQMKVWIVTLPSCDAFKMWYCLTFSYSFWSEENNVEIVIRRALGAPRMSSLYLEDDRGCINWRTILIVGLVERRRGVNSIDNIIVWRLRYEVIRPTNLYFIFYYG